MSIINFGNYEIYPWAKTVPNQQYDREIFSTAGNKPYAASMIIYVDKITIYRVGKDLGWVIRIPPILKDIWRDVYKPCKDELCHNSIEEAKQYVDRFLDKIIKLKAFL